MTHRLSVWGPAIVLSCCLAGCVRPKDNDLRAASKPVSNPEVHVEHTLELNLGFVEQDDSAWLFNIGNEDMVRPLESAGILQQEARLFGNKQVAPKDVTVLIRSDKDVPTSLIQELIKLCQDAGFEKFALSSPSIR